MFTGIVEETGRVEGVRRRDDVLVLEVRAAVVLPGLAPGASVAVNGCCLTATHVSADGFTCELTEETLSRTAFDTRLVPGALVNLERPLRADGRLDGHIVQGHVDGVGVIVSREHGDRWDDVRITLPAELARYVVEKGSICVDGISLTVTAVDAETFQISLIPTTLALTTLGHKESGASVNLEVDVIAKYVEKLVGVRT
jgi:riboflavin synthase